MSAAGNALVVGGSSGMGLATAHALAEKGWNVAIAARRSDVLESAVEELRTAHPEVKVDGHSVDIADVDRAQEVVETVAGDYGSLDGYVNAAGALYATPITEMTMEQWDECQGGMWRGVVGTTIAVVKQMKAQGGGRIVLIGGITGVTAEPGLSHYGAAKAAIHSLARSIAVEGAGEGIVANAVAPGWTRTPMAADYIDTMSRKQLLNINPLGRCAEPEEIASLVRYLIVEAPAFLTGSQIMIDGAQSVMAPLHGSDS